MKNGIPLDRYLFFKKRDRRTDENSRKYYNQDRESGRIVGCSIAKMLGR